MKPILDLQSNITYWNNVAATKFANVELRCLCEIPADVSVGFTTYFGCGHHLYIYGDDELTQELIENAINKDTNADRLFEKLKSYGRVVVMMVDVEMGSIYIIGNQR